METEAWPDETMRVTFLAEGPNTPLPPPGMQQTAYRFPPGTRVVFCGTGIGFVVAHDDYTPMHIDVSGNVRKAPIENAGPLIVSRANSMTGSEVLRFGAATKGQIE